MSGINLVCVPIQLEALGRWADERGWVRRDNVPVRVDRGRALHHLLTEVFGPRALRPFRLMVQPTRRASKVYAYSREDGEALREAAARFSWPDQLSVLGPTRITTKRMPTQWPEGQQLGFDVRARPVRRVCKPIRTRNGNLVGNKPAARSTELDAFLLEGLRNPDAKITRQDVYLDWLDERFSDAAKLDRTASRLVHHSHAPVARGKKIIHGPDAVVHGTLTVRNPTAFARLVWRGVGRHRAYGYGMLLLRPPQRAAKWGSTE